MVRNIRDILKILKVEDMEQALESFDTEVGGQLDKLYEALDMNLLSSDVTSVQSHMAYVESWGGRLVRYLSLATAFVEHAKSSVFLPAKTQEHKVSELERDAFRRKLAGGWVAWQRQLEELLQRVDSRVNIAKKVLGIEFDSSSRKAS